MPRGGGYPVARVCRRRAERLSSHGTGWDTDDALERAAEGRFRPVAEAVRELRNRDSLVTEGAECEMHAPAGHVPHGGLADQLREAHRESRAGDGDLLRERSKRPLSCRLAVDQGDRAADVPVPERAAGKSGRRVVERLTARGVPTRVGARSGEPPFDWDDRDTWAPVLQGVGSVYVSHYLDALPGSAEIIGSFAELAVANGIPRLVHLSGRGEAEAELAEEAVRNTGAEVTTLRSTWFSQNFSEGISSTVCSRGCSRSRW